ncbi:uncharacterized protein LOC129601513 isoform X2 [Paramacrobiotus metropolitanus]|uniref:uncharacterized protein LOC129601513 isoform X2 n=1 Tax=Paramacrobiotus metropolitanus TaxID=2943436 RepID=UPI00244619FE|nr:uncharacterized protein LOC129601513 isoform X2 [Paramacrobiotus metropolitanus]
MEKRKIPLKGSPQEARLETTGGSNHIQHLRCGLVKHHDVLVEFGSLGPQTAYAKTRELSNLIMEHAQLVETAKQMQVRMENLARENAECKNTISLLLEGKPISLLLEGKQ